MTAPYDVVGAGGLAYDLVLGVRRLPLDDQKYPAEYIGKLPGGFVANATCAAARLGLRAGYIGWVGDDEEGAMLHSEFLRWKVDPAGLTHVAGEVTPFTLVITDQRGGRSILLPLFPLYNALLSYEQLEVAAQARIVYTFPRDMAWCRQLHSAAQESGGGLALDVERAIPMRGGELVDAIRMADVVFVTESSLKAHGLPSIARLVRPHQWIIMTAGARGAYGIEHGMRKPVYRTAFDVPVLDTTGAGDCFHAAVLVARLEGATLPEALDFANAAAAIKVQHRGARGGLPARDEVDRFLRLRR